MQRDADTFLPNNVKQFVLQASPRLHCEHLTCIINAPCHTYWSDNWVIR